MSQKKVYDSINIDTLYGWNKRANDAQLDLDPGTQTPNTAMSLTEEEIQNSIA